MYVELGMTGKEIASELGVTEKTVSNWVNNHGWKNERNARIASSANQTENIRKIIAELAEDRIELTRKLRIESKEDKPEDLRKQIAGIDDAISKWNKTLMNIDKENKLSLSVYIAVMEQIFEAMLRYDPALHANTIQFQELHLKTIRLQLK